jgi:hypothetical protein
MDGMLPQAEDLGKTGRCSHEGYFHGPKSHRNDNKTIGGSGLTKKH